MTLTTPLDPAIPACPHFGTCGGCQYQDITQDSQLSLKQTRLIELTQDVTLPATIKVHAAEPYGYRNRIRLRIETVEGALRFGYNIRATSDFLPIVTCPIAAPVLWNTAETILEVAATNEQTAVWLTQATEIELFTNDTLDKLQLTFSCPPRTNLPQGFFARMMAAIVEAAPQVVGAAAIAVDPRIGPTGRTLETFGAPGLNYTVEAPTPGAPSSAAPIQPLKASTAKSLQDGVSLAKPSDRTPLPATESETYWISRGGFFQINRFLLPKLVELVTAGRSGKIAWDLFAGVGLFSRVLARNFASITAVESGPTASADLANALKKLGPQHRAVQATALDFLRVALRDRERPDLIVLDPPRAGAGEEACNLIGRIAPGEIVYVSCDPTTLAADWKVLESHGYTAEATHLVDLFPQTAHVETVVTFRKK